MSANVLSLPECNGYEVGYLSREITYGSNYSDLKRHQGRETGMTRAASAEIPAVASSTAKADSTYD
jgi:hypothetical protein